jgi:hypothetical protein
LQPLFQKRESFLYKKLSDVVSAVEEELNSILDEELKKSQGIVLPPTP